MSKERISFPATLTAMSLAAQKTSSLINNFCTYTCCEEVILFTSTDQAEIYDALMEKVFLNTGF